MDRASRVSLENVQRTLRQMDSNIRNLEQDLSNAKIPQSNDDLFLHVMGVSFFAFLFARLSNVTNVIFNGLIDNQIVVDQTSIVLVYIDFP